VISALMALASASLLLLPLIRLGLVSAGMPPSFVP
jgi:hypothetical protein